MEVLLVTGNEHKLREAQQVLSAYGVTLRKADIPKLELQGNIRRVAETAALLASMELLEPVVVDDSGLFVEALGGFPGAYSSFVYETIGNEGMLRLMSGIEDRRAHFETVVAFSDPLRRETRVFEGKVDGYIRRSAAVRPGSFGFDPIFSPYGPEGKAFSEMSVEEKNSLSHRGAAFRKLGEFLAGLQGP